MSAWGIVASVMIAVLAAILLVRHMNRSGERERFEKLKKPYSYDKGNGERSDTEDDTHS